MQATHRVCSVGAARVSSPLFCLSFFVQHPAWVLNLKFSSSSSFHGGYTCAFWGISYRFQIPLDSIALSHTKSGTENKHNLKHDHQHPGETSPVKNHTFYINLLPLFIASSISVLYSQSSALWDQEKRFHCVVKSGETLTHSEDLIV